MIWLWLAFIGDTAIYAALLAVASRHCHWSVGVLLLDLCLGDLARAWREHLK